MYPQNQQHQQTTFPVDRPVYPPQQIDVNRPPFVPNVPVAGWMQPYLPYITGTMIDMISRNCQVGPVSMFFYNQMSYNNWQNNDFVQAVHAVADYIFMETANNQPHPNQIGDMISRGVQTFLDGRTVYSIKQYPELWAYINEPDKRDLQQAHFAFEQVMGGIDQLRANTPPPMPYGQPVGGGHQPRAYGAPPQHQPYMAQQQAQQQAYQPNVPPAHQMMAAGYGPVPTAGSGRSYETSGNVPQMQQAPVHAPVGRPQTPAPKGPVMPPQAQVPELLDPATTPWCFSPEVPYSPAYNPVTHTLKYSMANGKTLPHLQEGNLDLINYDRHDIATLFGKPPVNSKVAQDNSVSNAKLQEGIADITEEMLNVDDKGQQVEYTMSLENVLAETSLTNAILAARSEMLYQTQTEPMVFRVLTQVYMPIMGKKSEHELIKSFGQSNSYIELREKLKAAGETASVELVYEVNARMTEHVNHILHKRLSILPENITMDDFTLELDELIDLLKANYGDNVTKAFLKDQKKNIVSLFRSINPTDGTDKALYSNLTDDILRGDWEGREDTPKFTFIGMTYSLTLLDVISHDLQIQGIPKVGNGLSPKYSPQLYNLAKNIFNTEDDTMNIAHHLIVTKDGRILEITRGDLADNWFLVSLVK